MNNILVYGLSSAKTGGIETFLFEMNRALSGEIVFNYAIEDCATTHQDIIDAYHGHVFVFPRKKKVIRNYFAWKKFLKRNRSKFDCVYFNMYSLSRFFLILLALRYKYRVCVHAHNNNIHNCSFLIKMLHRIGKRILLHKSIRRLANSNLSSRFFFGTKQDEATIIYCAIDTSKFAFSIEKRERIRSLLQIEHDKHVFGFVGRLTYQKNPLFLIDVFSEIMKLDSKARFLVIGSGDLELKMKQKVEELALPVIFTGTIPNVSDYYNAMDVFLLPSLFEGLGMVLVEAQTCGLPCLCSADVIPDFVKVTDDLKFIESYNAARWAMESIESLRTTSLDKRSNSHLLVSKTRFSIEHEAPLLRQCILYDK